MPSKPWFAAKRYGYGSGLPIAWQGWAVLTAYMLICGGSAFFLLISCLNTGVYVSSLAGIVLVATVILVVIYASKTKLAMGQGRLTSPDV